MSVPNHQLEAIPIIRIEPTTGWRSLKLSELWEYRELTYFLCRRDISVKYKQTILGASWAVLQPFLSMVVFSLFFGKLAKVPSDGVPYPIFSFAALVPWAFFSNALTQSSNSLVGNANLIKKVYFPRLIIPTAAVMAGIPDLLISLAVLFLMMLAYGLVPSVAGAMIIPALVLLAVISALGVGLWLSALNVEYRDIKYVVPFLTQLWLFATPVAYPASLLSEPWRTLFAINPMVGVVEGMRWALLRTNNNALPLMIVSSVTAIFLLVGGAFYFRQMEKRFADVI